MGDYFDEDIPTSVLQEIMDYRAEGASLVRKYPPDLRGLLMAIQEISASFYQSGHIVHAMLTGNLDFVIAAGIDEALVPDELSDFQVGMGEGYMRAYILLNSMVEEFITFANEQAQNREED